MLPVVLDMWEFAFGSFIHIINRYPCSDQPRRAHYGIAHPSRYPPIDPSAHAPRPSLTLPGRLLYNPRFSGLRAELLNKDSVSVDNKVVAILDRNSGGKMIRLFDIERRQPMGIIKHSQEILTVGLNQFTRSQARMCLFIDRNYDLHIATVSPNPKIAKVATMVDTAIWNDCSDMLTAIADGVLVTWLYPYVFVRSFVRSSSFVVMVGGGWFTPVVECMMMMHIPYV